MTAPESDGPALLRGEILEQARRQKEEMLRRARDTAARIIGKAEEEAGQTRKDKLDAAQAEAARRREAILATISVEKARMRLARIEQWLQGLHDQARDELRNGHGFDRRDVIIGLAGQALGRMTGERFVLRLPSAEFQRWGQGLAEEVPQAGTRPSLTLEVKEDPNLQEGRWVLQDQEGRQLWELGPEARLERLWPEIRRQIAAQVGLVEKEKSLGEGT